MGRTKKHGEAKWVQCQLSRNLSFCFWESVRMRRLHRHPRPRCGNRLRIVSRLIRVPICQGFVAPGTMPPDGSLAGPALAPHWLSTSELQSRGKIVNYRGCSQAPSVRVSIFLLYSSGMCMMPVSLC